MGMVVTQTELELKAMDIAIKDILPHFGGVLLWNKLP